MFIRKIVTTLLLYGMLVACGNSEPGIDRYSTRHVATEEIIGTWRPTAGSLRYLERKTAFTKTDREHHKIQFDASGTCRFRSHWQCSYVDAEDPEDTSYFVTDNSRWRIGTVSARVGTVTFEASAVSISLVQGKRSAPIYYYVSSEVFLGAV